MIRFYSKSFWVFPQFYGDYYVACARNLWSNCLDLETVSGVKIRDHIAKKGIHTLNQFTEHCKECERIFWYERFNVYREWKEKENQFYIENGYTKSYLGFRFTGYMEPKKVTNYEIQGTAYHIMQNTLNQVNQTLKEDGWKSYVIGQIHDSMIFIAYEEELNDLLKLVQSVGVDKTMKDFPWIIVPLKIEFEASPIGGSWYEKQVIEIKGE